MLLTYRGVSYDYTPNPNPKFGPVYAIGAYRGVMVPFRALTEMPAQLSLDLTWRGVPYRTGANIQEANVQEANIQAVQPTTAPEPVASPSAPATPSILQRLRGLVMRRHRQIRQREQAMLGRLNEEVGLTAEDATQYESEIQGKTPHDFGGYDRNHAAMS